MWAWAQTLQWPKETENAYDEPGISWIELYVNYVTVTGKTLPVADKPRQEGYQTYKPLESKEIQLLPQTRRNASVMAQTLQAVVNTLGTLTGEAILPKHSKKDCRSLVRMGAH